MQFLMYSPDPMPQDATPPTPQVMAEMGKLIEESEKAGILVTTGAFMPNTKRVKLAGGKYSVTDGPFIEAKELMGGFAVIEVKSLEEAIAWSKRFRDIVGEGTSEIVPIIGPRDFSGG